MNKSLLVIFATIGLDATGIGLIFPILPTLLREVTHSQNIAAYIGVMTALYALMQFIFAPLLGAISDNIGRRPVLLLSLAGSAINYVIMAFAPHLWMLLLGRAIAGLTSANMSVSMAWIADTTPIEQRARRFGLLNATFGAGFIVGPVLGGVLGDSWVRLPFIVAAALTGANLLLALWVLPESHPPSSQKIGLTALNPLRPLRWVFTIKDLLPVALVFFFLSAAGESYGTCWALWGNQTFNWDGIWIGLSLGAFGVFQMLAQILLPGPLTRLLGERKVVLVALLCDSIALIMLSLAGQGWMVFAIMPLSALGGVGTPALQTLASRLVGTEHQGQLQGVLASAISLASIIGPLVFSSLYLLLSPHWPGAIWLTVMAVYGCAVPLIILSTRTAQRTPD